MRKKMRFFRQHTNKTCGAACILMLLDYYGKVEYPTQKMELKLYSHYRSPAFMGLHGSYVADALAWNGLQVQLFHSEEAMMKNRDGYFEEELFRAMHREYLTRAEKCANKVEIRCGMALDTRFLKSLLAEGKQVMVQCIVPGNADGIHDEVLHWVLAYGWQDGEFLLCDPAYGKARIPEAEMEHYLDTPIGKIFLAVRN